ncbi:MAG: asparagine--tRNA ligase [Candidatus Nanoarchaeia archaeon]|nr:asparagine--tRNA ligase [Candidatus Nanoarchaeia archaeon]
MFGPYNAEKDGTISYIGNKLFKPIKNINNYKLTKKMLIEWTNSLKFSEIWPKIARINHTINKATNNYFDTLGALFTILPLTTRMISSPGAVYGKEVINYTTDTSPIKLKWFNLKKPVFLSESSQIYLELALMQKEISQVYSIYNSFRKEQSDAHHLSEFHHIEYEGKINQKQNIKIIKELFLDILKLLLENNKEDISFFIGTEGIMELEEFVKNFEIKEIDFKEVLKILKNETGNKKYDEFSLKHFGAWEEVFITRKLNKMLCISKFPLFEVPFYHAEIKDSKPSVANNSDFIWLGYREFIGSRERVGNIKDLEKKAEIFNLPKYDYLPYLQSRKYTDYITTSGFGLGWERFLQGLLKMPTIWLVCQFPRTHIDMIP